MYNNEGILSKVIHKLISGFEIVKLLRLYVIKISHQLLVKNILDGIELKLSNIPRELMYLILICFL